MNVPGTLLRSTLGVKTCGRVGKEAEVDGWRSQVQCCLNKGWDSNDFMSALKLVELSQLEQSDGPFHPVDQASDKAAPTEKSSSLQPIHFSKG